MSMFVQEYQWNVGNKHSSTVTVRLTIFRLHDGANVIPIKAMRQSTLYYKMGFVLSDFAQLLTSGKCSELVKVGYAKP